MQEKLDLIMSKKMSTPLEVVRTQYCPELATYVEYCQGLGFGERPDYAHLRKLLKDRLFRQGFQNDLHFDWCDGPGSRSPSRQSSGVEEHEDRVLLNCQTRPLGGEGSQFCVAQ